MILEILLILILLVFIFKQTDNVKNIFVNQWKWLTNSLNTTKTNLKRLNYSEFINFFQYAGFYEIACVKALLSSDSITYTNIIERYKTWLVDNNYDYTIVKKEDIEEISTIIKKDDIDTKFKKNSKYIDSSGDELVIGYKENIIYIANKDNDTIAKLTMTEDAFVNNNIIKPMELEWIIE